MSITDQWECFPSADPQLGSVEGVLKANAPRRLSEFAEGPGYHGVFLPDPWERLSSS